MLNKVLLITGGSRGIGAATALLAAQQGWAVGVNYSSHSKAADQVVQQIISQGGRAMAVQADVANEGQVLAMFDQVQASWDESPAWSTTRAWSMHHPELTK